MAIDRIYVVCNKKDYYFAQVAVASIRYWNNSIPISLIKDKSKGDFDSNELEKYFQVTLAVSSISKMGYYAKLLPLIEQTGENRIFIMDADCCWMGNLSEVLVNEHADFMADVYLPKDVAAEKLKWYFREPGFTTHYPDYHYPGFLFNVGHFYCKPEIFSASDWKKMILWKENPAPLHEKCFFHEQGMLNYLIAKKINQKEITFSAVPFHRWGWDPSLKAIKLSELKNQKSYPFLIHWYGKKNGLLGSLPKKEILRFYEKYYYKQLPNGQIKKSIKRFIRTWQHFPAFCFGLGKSLYYFINPVK